ncbi:uncharacterized protein MYCFIDRAFT_193880 [Pseudocercospora fijiensis CIRAD86]|uniref:Uncharacterized protein n=1 Tax=Pseudocercospora fijiensis (strain CIRAD86) TaxID=383855 RepID=M2Z756_PSEFD|nr:uncharacterized protein MYCFIDRAFT_193880 [Pseudocercospora fijiensis CIRAD86]EME85620.1 hypothetical protein MYCFIDRAFT_193880 [Pseudocercospora fijiensis CIRAD86]
MAPKNSSGPSSSKSTMTPKNSSGLSPPKPTMTPAEKLAQNAPQLKSHFDQAIQAGRPNLLTPVSLPDAHAHTLACYLRDMVIDRRFVYLKGRNKLQDLGIELQSEHEFPGDRGYPTSHEDLVYPMASDRAGSYAMMMLQQVVGFNQSIVTIEAHLEQLRIQREMQQGQQEGQQKGKQPAGKQQETGGQANAQEEQ